jgi:hypothetical protein
MSRLTHDRMQAIVLAAADCLDAHEAMSRAILALPEPITRDDLEAIILSITYRPPQAALTLLALERRYYQDNIARLRRNSERVANWRARKIQGIEKVSRAKRKREAIVPTVPAGTDLNAWHEARKLRAAQDMDRSDVSDTLDI